LVVTGIYGEPWSVAPPDAFSGLHGFYPPGGPWIAAPGDLRTAIAPRLLSWICRSEHPGSDYPTAVGSVYGGPLVISAARHLKDSAHLLNTPNVRCSLMNPNTDAGPLRRWPLLFLRCHAPAEDARFHALSCRSSHRQVQMPLLGKACLLSWQLPPPAAKHPLADPQAALDLFGGHSGLGGHPHCFQLKLSIIRPWHRHTSIFLKYCWLFGVSTNWGNLILQPNLIALQSASLWQGPVRANGRVLLSSVTTQGVGHTCHMGFPGDQ